MNAGAYGSLCPTCGLPAVAAERCINGKVGCANGHWWSRTEMRRPFADALYGNPPLFEQSPQVACSGACSRTAAQPDADLTVISR